MLKPKHLAFVLIVSCFLSATLFAQGTKADYKRAKNIQSVYNRAFDSRPGQIHWLPDGKGIWFRGILDDRRSEYHRVDLTTGKISPLFDRERLVKAISAVNKDQPAPSLAVLNAAITPTGIRLRLQGDHHLWDVRFPQYSVTKRSLEAAPTWKLKRTLDVG